LGVLRPTENGIEPGLGDVRTTRARCGRARRPSGVHCACRCRARLGRGAKAVRRVGAQGLLTKRRV